MRITHVIPSLATGGAERMVSLLAPELARMGHDVAVVSLSRLKWNDEIVDAIRDADIELEFLDKRIGLDVRVASELRHFVQERNPDIIHSHSHALKYAFCASSRSRTKVLHTEHTDPIHAHDSGNLARLERLAYRLGAEGVVLSERFRDSFKTLYGKEPFGVVGNGIEFTPAPVRGPTRPVAIFVGRLDPPKRVDLLLEAFAKVPDEANDGQVTSLLIIGGGALDAELRATATRLGVDARVTFAGSLPRQSVISALSQARVFVVSSDYEGSPIAVLEAIRAGLPIVSTDVGALRQMVEDGVSGYLVPVGSSDRLAGRITDVLLDEDVAIAMGDHSRQLFSGYTVEAMASNYEQLYERLVGQRLTPGDV